MKLLKAVDQILLSMRGVFRRQRAFDLFVLVTYALMLRMDSAGVTSIVRCYGLAPCEYYNLLHFFHSSAWCVKDLCAAWAQQGVTHLEMVRIQGSPLYVVDAIKVGKAGERMPGVKLLHQESEDNSKPEYIMGHYLGAVAALVEAGRHVFAVPLRLQVQDGLKRSPSQKTTLVTKMVALLLDLLVPGALPAPQGPTVVADAYFASLDMLEALLAHGIGYIGRVRINTVAHQPPPPRCPHTRGRPRKYGDKVVLRDLFKQPHLFTWTEMELYGEVKSLHYYVCDLLWQGIPVRFVLSIYKNGKEVILISTRFWSAEEIIRAYELRFKIEVTFKALVHLLAAFCYHFWMKLWPKTVNGDKNVYLHRHSRSFVQQVDRKIEAYERFVNLAAIALGLLQYLAVCSASLIWDRFPLWLRTLPRHGCPTELIVRLTLQYELRRNFLKSRGSTLLEKILATRKTVPDSAHPIRLTR